MIATQQGSLKLFRFFGIQVYLHWSWFFVALYEVQSRKGSYSSIAWNVAEYIALFLIVLLHEFGHSLACRQVGGKSDTIVLWPFGGIAFVRPPPRPAAELWSIAAGPLVNVVLFPILWALVRLGAAQGWADNAPDLFHFLRAVWFTNFGLLLFNILPIYPLDGGQIFRSLLWFLLGRVRSLFIATVVGFFGIVAALFYLLLYQQAFSLWTLLMAFFLFQQCWAGFRYARALQALERAPRHADFSCPICQTAPPLGATYACSRCNTAFDPFTTSGQCPHCANTVATIPCLHCGTPSSLEKWAARRTEAVRE